MKPKIINILLTPPFYEACKDNWRPKQNWDLPDGSWVGFAGWDWPDLIGNEVLKNTDEFQYEVWQIDFRADKIYSHRFESGHIHKLFPASMKRRLLGFKIVNELSSDLLIENIKKISDDNVILHLNSLGHYMNQEIIRKFHFIPKVINFHSKISSIPYQQVLRVRKNILANIAYFKWHNELKTNKKIIFTYNNSQNIEFLTKYNHLGIERTFMGCDFDYWKPGNKEKAKKVLGINPGTRVFSMASRFNKLKQIDKVIEIFTDIDKDNRYNLMLLIAGHGNKEYEDYLIKISKDLEKKNKLKFPGFLEGDEMKTLYHASDLFISASTSEGGPTSVVKAISCETPIMCTQVGGVDDILEQYNTGLLVNNYNYKDWKEKILDVLTNQIRIKLMDRDKAKEMLHWPIIARKYIEIYNKLLSHTQRH